MQQAARRATWIFVALVAVVALHDLGGRSLHQIDTARWGQLAREMIRSGEWLVPTRYGELYVNKPPLYLWAVAGPARLAGEVTPFLVRLPSAVGLVLLVLSTAWWARQRTGVDVIGRMAGLLALGSFGVLWLGREGRLDMLGAGLCIAAAAQLDAAARGGGTRRTPWLVGLLLGACLLTKGPPLLLVPAAVLFYPSPGQRLAERLRVARPLLSLGVGAAVALAWFVPGVLSAGWEAYGHPLLVGQAAERITGETADRAPVWFYLVGTPVAAAPWGLAYLGVLLAACTRRGRRALGPTAGLAVAALVLFVVFSAFPTKHYRYLAPIVPLMAIPLAAWLHSRLSHPPRARWRRHLVALGAVLGLAGAACLVAGALRAGAFLATLVPGLLLLAASAAALAPARAPGAGEAVLRQRFVLVLLHATVILLLGVAVARSHFHVARKERFNLRLAELRAGDVPVFVTRGMSPENVFHGAPRPRFPHDAEAPLPPDAGPRVLVVCPTRDVAAVLAATPRPGRMLYALPDGYDWAIVGFGYP